MSKKNNATLKSVFKSIVEKVEPIIRFVNFPLAYLSGRSENMEKALFYPIIKSYSKNNRNHFIQYTAMPKNIDLIQAEWTDNSRRFSEFAIILQGPIQTEDNFTINTVRLYKKCYPGASIIVSTWMGTDKKIKDELQKIGAILIESRAPAFAGPGHINMQLVSSLAGMEKVKTLGCKYAVKTRTDQRIYANDMLQYYRNLLEIFPSDDAEVVSKRIIYTSYGTSYRYLPFNLCDFVVFGETEELIKLYSIPFDNHPDDYHKRIAKETKPFIREIFNNLETKYNGSPYKLFPDFETRYYRYWFGEYYIVYHYFAENICQLKQGDDLIDAYYFYLKKYAIVADSEKLLLYWPKYAENIAKYKTELDFLAKLDFKKWLDIYLHYQPKNQWKTKNVQA